jgi:3-phenylpropionate/cinnamic acid dioxygenase small subunit
MYEDLTKQREDKDEKFEQIKNNTKELLERLKTSEKEVNQVTEDITRQNVMITNIKIDKNEKEKEKIKLDSQTIEL